MNAEWTVTLQQVFQDVQLQAVEASGYLRNSSGLEYQRTLVPAVRRLHALYCNEVKDGERGVVEEAFALFLDGLWTAVARVLVASKVSEVVLVAISSFIGEFFRRKTSKSKEPSGKDELRVELLHRLMDATKAEDRVVRLRSCHMLQIVVNRLDYIEEKLTTQLRTTLLNRLKDKLTSVRIQSIYGLKKLQRQDLPLLANEEDIVTQELKRLLESDPSKDVRKAALLNVTISPQLYQDLLVRIRDTNEDVRFAAFRTIRSSMSLQDITVHDRVHLLDQGLQDRAVRVRRACEQMVVKTWFLECNSSPRLLLKALEIEQHPEIGSKVSRLLLEHFSEQPRAMGEARVEFNALDMMSKTSDAFTVESIFFWREQCWYYQQIEKNVDKAAALLPNVSDFSQMLVATCTVESNVLVIAQQLLELGHLLDYQDEVGRRNLLDALQTLLRELETNSQLIQGIMELMACIYSKSSEQEFIQVVAEIVSDMYDLVEIDTLTMPQDETENQLLHHDIATTETSAQRFGPQLHKLSEETREAAEIKFEELEKSLETLEIDSQQYNDIRIEMAALEALLQDPRVLHWLRCLEIVAQLLKLTSHTLSDPIISGMGRYILPAIDSDVPALREAGLENLGLYCLLDKRLAERYLVVFWRALNNPEEESEVKHTCVQAILDMAFSFTNLLPHIFGTTRTEEKRKVNEKTCSSERNERGRIEPTNEQSGHEEVTKDHENQDESDVVPGLEMLDLDTIFINLGQLVTVDDVDLQSTVVEGFCRLFMMNRLDNITVLAILLETYFSPKLQKLQQQSDYGFQSRSLQLLSMFFPAFVMATSVNCMLLEEAATHLIQKSMEKLTLEHDTMLDLGACAKYVMQLLSHRAQESATSVQMSDTKHQNVPTRRHCAHHNRIGITICLEMLALEKVAAMAGIRQDLVTSRQKTLLKMIAWVEVTLDEPRSAALLKYLLYEILACFHAQKGLLRSAEAVLKRTCASYKEQCRVQMNIGPQTVALEQDQVWAHSLVTEREVVLHHVLLKASTELEKSFQKQEKKRRHKTRFVSSSSSESDEDMDDKSPVVAVRRELSSRRSKTAAVSRMHEKEGEFEAKMKQALEADKRESESEDDESAQEESDEEDTAESDSDE
ncbi:hypothetical protein CCR75_009122 [Bremia lactucae]|uniref:Nuclear condensin complex subunit 3 C-terminal domain-containing protein n=1 Tax=Bremia lactucae TaxID=4779 RepID=A0A976FN87_BRELC|nr:hypothetical protein CCR75_009122 [Bremia lactucae]